MSEEQEEGGVGLSNTFVLPRRDYQLADLAWWEVQGHRYTFQEIEPLLYREVEGGQQTLLKD